MTETEKAKETLQWLALFDLMRENVNKYAFSSDGFNQALKTEINKIRKQCNELIEDEN